MTHNTTKHNATIDVRLGEPGRARILINGVDLSKLVQRVEFVMEPNKTAQAVLYCRARQVQVFGVCDVITDADSAVVEPPPLRHIDGMFSGMSCEVCPRQATSVVADICEQCNYVTGFKTDRPVDYHYFCSDHHRAPMVVDIEMIVNEAEQTPAA